MLASKGVERKNGRKGLLECINRICEDWLQGKKIHLLSGAVGTRTQINKDIRLYAD